MVHRKLFAGVTLAVLVALVPAARSGASSPPCPGGAPSTPPVCPVPTTSTTPTIVPPMVIVRTTVPTPVVATIPPPLGAVPIDAVPINSVPVAAVPVAAVPVAAVAPSVPDTTTVAPPGTATALVTGLTGARASSVLLPSTGASGAPGAVVAATVAVLLGVALVVVSRRPVATR